MAKRNDFYHDGSILGKTAAEQLDINAIVRDDKDMRSARAEAGAIRAAEGAGVKKTVTSFRDGFVGAFNRTCEERQRIAVEQAKPVFWGTKEAKREAWDDNDTKMWTLVSVMDEVRSGHKDIAQHLESVIRDAQRTLDRVRAIQVSEVVNDRLYPIYDENLGQMGIRVDVAVAKQRQLQESTRTMISLVGMRLPSREELVAKGLIKEEAE
jgi:hypothetical protein